MILSKVSIYWSFCITTVGAICTLHYLLRNINTAILQPNCTSCELRKISIETKRHGERYLDNYESCAFDKAECIGRLSSQDTALQKYSLLLSEFQAMHHGVTSHKGALSRMQEQKTHRKRIQAIPSMIEWKHETRNAFSIPPMNPKQPETQPDVMYRVQNRDNILCRERFSVGPYYVQIGFGFALDGAKQEQTSIIIEVPSRLYLPHTVLSFLALIEAEQYAGFRVWLSPTILSVEGNQADRSAETNDSLEITRATLGFVESSTRFPCIKHSVGFVGYGPQFMIILESDREKTLDDRAACFGRVVRGMDSLQTLQAEAAKGSTIQVIWSRNLDL